MNPRVAKVRIVSNMAQTKYLFRWCILCGGLLLSVSSLAADFSQQLNGRRLTYQSAKCAGLLFDKSGKTAYQFNEVSCKPDLELRVNWLADDMVLLVEKNQLMQTVPPRTFLYRVKSVKKVAVLTQIWTGWGSYKDQDYYFNVE